MKKVWMMALPLMAAFTACSDDDGPKGPVVEYEVITFENCEFAEGAKNNVVRMRNFRMRIWAPSLWARIIIQCMVAALCRELPRFRIRVLLCR